MIQIESSHIILTDAATLNKLLGCEVYTSKNPLGGVLIMYDIEVSRVTVRDDLEGCYTMLRWLSYMPRCKGAELPITESIDPFDRDVVFTPTKAPYDPRCLLTGRKRPNLPGLWEGAFFDRGQYRAQNARRVLFCPKWYEGLSAKYLQPLQTASPKLWLTGLRQ